MCVRGGVGLHVDFCVRVSLNLRQCLCVCMSVFLVYATPVWSISIHVCGGGGLLGGHTLWCMLHVWHIRVCGRGVTCEIVRASIFEYVSVSLCPCVSVSLYLCVSVSLCLWCILPLFGAMVWLRAEGGGYEWGWVGVFTDTGSV